MRVLFFGNGVLARDVAEFLTSAGEQIVAAVVHPAPRARQREEILAAAKAGGGSSEACVVAGDRLSDPDTIRRIQEARPDIGVSILFGYRVPPEILRIPPRGCINLHPALLPHNRGAYPNVWSIVERTPAGVTLHAMDEGFDTGDMIAQREVPADAADTGETLYRRLEAAGRDLFRETWSGLRDGTAARRPQPPGGSFHRVADVAAIDEIELDRTYLARELIDRLRARTFPPHTGTFFRDGDRKIYLELALRAEETPRR